MNFIEMNLRIVGRNARDDFARVKHADGVKHRRLSNDAIILGLGNQKLRVVETLLFIQHFEKGDTQISKRSYILFI